MSTRTDMPSARLAAGPGRVEPMTPAHLPEVLALYQRLWLKDKVCSPRAMEEYFSGILFDHPWTDASIQSLVYRDAGGHVLGCMGMLPRRMTVDGRALRVVVSHNFMVDPDHRSPMVAIELMKALFAGSQDVTIAEGNDLSRKLWERLGGSTALIHNLRWVRPLRPAEFVLNTLRGVGLPPFLQHAVRPFCRVVDHMVQRAGWKPFRYDQAGRSEDVSEQTLAELAARWAMPHWVWPQYDLVSLTWLFNMLRRKRGIGTLRARHVAGADGKTAGAFVYFAKPGGTSEVLQMLAAPQSIDAVLDHLFMDAWSQGSCAVSGQLEPRYMRDMTARHCSFKHSGSWMLVHSRDATLMNRIQRGHAYVSRLDGEWWIGLHEGTF